MREGAARWAAGCWADPDGPSEGRGRRGTGPRAGFAGPGKRRKPGWTGLCWAENWFFLFSGFPFSFLCQTHSN